MKNEILIFYDWYSPAFKAGGPIQSLNNLVAYLEKEHQVKILCSNKDNDNSILNVLSNSWTQISDSTSIWYNSETSIFKWIKFIKQQQSKIWYLNGIYSLRYNIIPILFKRKSQVVIAPRGMLQKGALSNKKFKKYIYIFLLNLFGGLKNVYWHATDEQEALDIKKCFPYCNKIFIVSNIPKPPVASIMVPDKKQGVLNLIYLSLISQKKNLHLLLKSIQNLNGVTLDIYGPIKDKNYWERKCKPALNEMQNIAKYKGEVEPANVQSIIANYDVFILLTNGENFGHAIYESLSVGRPILISNFTPWNNLKQRKIGVNIDIDNSMEIKEGIEYFRDMDYENFTKHCLNAYEYSKDFYFKKDILDKYKELFNIDQ